MAVPDRENTIKGSPWKEILLSLPMADILVKHAGTGDHVLVCFHGYLQNRHFLDPVFGSIPPGWQIVSVDLPCFGGSRWKSPMSMDASFFISLMENLESVFTAQHWHFLGFSMGGKMAMAMHLYTKAKEETVILIAPDGIRSNPWHRLIASTFPGSFLFELVSRFPQPFIRIASFLNRKRILDKISYRVFIRNFGSKQAIKAFRTYLLVYGQIRFSLKELAKLQAAKPVEWYIIWGREDRVMSPGHAKRLTKKIPQAQIIVPEGGHMIISDDPFTVRKLLGDILFH
ncbi:MAG: alpha/beta hydrolase [Bacteroidia bacterium]